MSNLQHRLDIATTTVAGAAQLALSFFHRREQFALEQKAANEFVTEADRLVEDYIRRSLAEALPNDAVQGEEGGGETGQAFWSVDPIDGTSNFLRGSPLWGVSLGYMVDGVSQVGVVHYPVLGMTLAAAAGHGVTFQGQPFTRHVPFGGVRVAAVGDSTAWPADSIAAVEHELRRSGSAVAQYRCASIGLGFAALGYTDGYVEQHFSVWDLAAGAVICKEAGLVVEYGGSHEAQGMWIRAGIQSLHDATSGLVPSRR